MFLPSCPDYTVCVAMLNSTDKYAFIDKPLFIAGSARESIGSSSIYQRGEATNQYFAEFGDEDLLARAPLKSLIAVNYVADSILRVKEKMSTSLSDVPLDWEGYFTGCYSQIMQLCRRGVNTAADEAEFFAVLARQPEPLPTRVREVIMNWTMPAVDQRRGISGHLRKAARRIINYFSFLGRIESYIRNGTAHGHATTTSQQQWPMILRGEELGFSNILECSHQLANILHGLQ